MAATLQVIGTSLQLNGESFTVIGVMPASFVFPGPLSQLWSPIAFPPGSSMDSRNNYFVELLGRLKPGVTPDEALTDLSTIAERLRREFPQNVGKGVTLEEWQELIVGGIRPTLLFLLGAVAFVLLIACANVANLLLARAATRAHELTVRATIGAGRGRLVRQLLTEHLALASLGAVAGVLLAYAVIRGIPALGPTGVPRLTEATMDGRVVGFASALALLPGWSLASGRRVMRGASAAAAVSTSRHARSPAAACVLACATASSRPKCRCRSSCWSARCCSSSAFSASCRSIPASMRTACSRRR